MSSIKRVRSASRAIPLLLAGGLLFGLMLLISSCGTETTVLRLQNSPSVPAAQGTVEVSEGDQGQTQLDIRVNYLAKPGQVTPGARVYVVWVRPVSATGLVAAQNVGAFDVDDDLQGEMKTETPLRYFNVFITAEPNADVTVPTGNEVLSTQVSM